MSTTNCVRDGNSQTETKYDDELDYNNLWEPWKNIIISVKTATANISHLQKLAKRKNKQINTHDFAEALEDRNLLQHTITIQIASNGNFISIEFGKQWNNSAVSLYPSKASTLPSIQKGGKNN